MESKSKLERKAFLSGFITFIVLYFLLLIFGYVTGLRHGKLLLSLQILVFVISGYVSGRVAGQSGWKNGLIVGIPLPFVLAIGFILMAPKGTVSKDLLLSLGVFWFLQALFLCAIGGLMSDIQRRLSKPRQ
jgi:MFS family permease